MLPNCFCSLPCGLNPETARLVIDDTELAMNVSSFIIEQSVNTVPQITLEGGVISMLPTFRYNTSLKAKRVIYHNPATIVIWEDGTKTVVKCGEKDEYNPMLGLALCYMKKALGNSSRKLNDALHAEGF